MSNINNISKMNSMRMTGLGSGLDVEGMIKKMMLSQQSRLDKVKQQRELVSWQKDAYRSVITMMNAFQSKFLDILSPNTISLTGSFKPMSVNVPQGMSQYFTAAAASGSGSASLTVNKITQLATAQKMESSHTASKPVALTPNADKISDILGKSLSFSVNGETKNITFSANAETYMSEGVFDIDKLAADINDKLDKAFGTQEGEPRVKFEVDGNSLVLAAAPKNTVQITGASAVTSALGVNNTSNHINLGSAIGSVFTGTAPSGSPVKFKINDVEFTFAQTTTIRDMMNEINRSAANVNLSYSTFSDKFTLAAAQTGSGDNLKTEDTDGTSFLEKMFGAGVMTEGEDARLTVNGEEIFRRSNSVTIEGITINLLQTTPEDFISGAVTAKIDSSKVIDTIKEFVSEYNSLIDSLNNMLSERRPRLGNALYMPLTEDQKAAMSDKEASLWEEMGKKGLLNNDPVISRMLSSLRMAMAGTVDTGDGKISMASIGIKASSYFEDKTGKLSIDEDTLRAAIENDPEAVTKLFTAASPIPKDAKMDDYFQKDANGRYYTTGANGAVKYVSANDFKNMRSEGMGISRKFAEIFDANIKATVNEKDRGALIKLVGTGSNLTIDKTSTFDKRLADMDKNIERIQNRLYAAETKYYKQFATLETALARLNKQSVFLSNFGDNGQQ